jgi:plasmid stabilization system protein ParE
MSFRISADVDAQVTAAAVFYDSKPSRYGDEFKAEFAKAARAIMASPRLYSPVEDGIPGREIREHFIERFQQRVIYLVTGDDVLVVAVIHATRRPGAWHRNLPTDPPSETT